uniref:Uncharacterized protein MANES_09G018800 n=1 Tax=Rhizophora mucronata TaxID=61149 RepID=A0A2P2LQD9_RHIMU
MNLSQHPGNKKMTLNISKVVIRLLLKVILWKIKMKMEMQMKMKTILQPQVMMMMYQMKEKSFIFKMVQTNIKNLSKCLFVTIIKLNYLLLLVPCLWDIIHGTENLLFAMRIVQAGGS